MTHHPGDFFAYPTNRVVGTIADAANARAAIEELLQAGVDPPGALPTNGDSTGWTRGGIEDWLKQSGRGGTA